MRSFKCMPFTMIYVTAFIKVNSIKHFLFICCICKICIEFIKSHLVIMVTVHVWKVGIEF